MAYLTGDGYIITKEAGMLTWNGDVISGAAAMSLLERVVILDKEFTKSTGVESDGKNTIWLVEVDGQKAILKRTEQFYRSLRCQIFLDELKPLFGIPKIGSLLCAPGGKERPTLLMQFVGGGQALVSRPVREWLWNDAIVDTLVRITLLDMVVANSSRKARNILISKADADGKPIEIVPIDEEQAMDFAIQPEFRMSHAIRRRLTMIDLDPHLEALGLSERVAGVATATLTTWRLTAERYYRPDHAQAIVDRMFANAVDIRRRYFKYLDNSYGAATRSGVPSRSKRGPQPWEKEP